MSPGAARVHDLLRRPLWHLQVWIGKLRYRAERRRHAAAHPVEARIEKLRAQADDAGIESLSARQQMVVRAWAGLGVIHNGGFRYFLESDWPLEPVAQGFGVLGFEAAGAACERVQAAIAASPGLTERERRAATHDARGHDGFDAEDAVISKVSFECLVTAIRGFMAQYPQDFPGVPRQPSRASGS